MKELNVLHERAMALAEEASLVGKRGDAATERALLLSAFEAERDAAMLVFTSFDLEPTRSVLFRSAAALALDAGIHREAERMASFGLSGRPPDTIAEELRDLLEEANFARHLDLKGIELLPNEIQIAMWEGSAVGSGIIRSDELVSRVKRIEQLSARTIARKRGLPFEEQSPLPKGIRSEFQTFVSAPRHGSFAFTIRLGAAPQLGLFQGDSNVDIILELVELLDLVNNSKTEELERRIPDEAYRRNFIAQAKEIAPDGKRVREVGITAIRDANPIQIRFETRKQLPLTPSKPPDYKGDELGDEIELYGELRVARAYRGHGITIVGESGSPQKIKVPKGMLNDIVRPYFGERVRVIAQKTTKGLELVDIFPEEYEE